MRIGRGYQLSQALYVAAKLGVADVLGSEPLAAEAIAEAVDVRAPELRRVLRALVAAGVFTELADGRFATNDAPRRCAPTHLAACATWSSTSARKCIARSATCCSGASTIY